jgi:predicted O-methyltransferase YrrM
MLRVNDGTRGDDVTLHGTTITKASRLVGHLARNPADIGRYLTTGPLSKKAPLDLGLPWFSYGAIDFLKRYVKPEMTVFEYGSGGSTVFFAQRVKSVVATEDDALWLERVRERLQASGNGNVELQHRPFDFTRAEGFVESDYLQSIPDRKFDIIIVDGMEHSVKVRPQCFAYAQDYVKRGGIIVVDDAWRYPELYDLSRAKFHQVFQSIGPCRPGITTTNVFSYE